MQTVEQLTATNTADDFFNQMILWLVNMGLPADKWRKGGVARSVLRVVAMSFATLGAIITFVATSAFLPTATGDWLTLVALYVYGVTRVKATFATGQIVANNSGGGIYTFQPFELIVQDEDTLKSYTNVATVNIGAGQMGVVIDIEATELGTDSNAAAAKVTVLFTPANGVTITNPLPIVGLDEQTDPDLRDMCIAKLGSLSFNGPRGAYRYAIKVAKLVSGAAVNVNRFSISPSSSTGIVQIYLAAPSGTVTSDDITAVQDSIEAIARPDTATVLVSATTVQTYAPNLTVYAVTTPGLDEPTLQTIVADKLTAYAETYPIGGLSKPPATTTWLFDETVRAVAQSAHVAIYDVDSDGSDLALTPSQVAAIVPASITVRFVTTAAT